MFYINTSKQFKNNIKNKFEAETNNQILMKNILNLNAKQALRAYLMLRLNCRFSIVFYFLVLNYFLMFFLLF
jgi:hypothetical protein